jgi:diguanylate cyclase (GGDEF)-like protein
MVRRLLAAYRERVQGRPDSEHSQALLRIGIVWVLLVYTSWVAGHDPVGGGWLWAINLSSAVFSVVLFARILWRPRASPPRRLVGAFHDNLAVTVWLHQAGPIGALYLFVYPFVTVGNGFRFGVRYLAWSAFLGAVGIGSLLVSASAWQAYEMIGLSALLSHVLVTGYVGVLLRRLRQMQEQLEKLATHDALTGLPNRRLFMDQLGHALASRRRGNLACLYFDLDGFKAVNDRRGHAVGDRVLKRVAERVASCVRAADVPARLGGDEFAVLLDDLPGPEEACALATRLIRTIEAIAVVDGHAIAISASVGVAFLPGGEPPAPIAAEALVKEADEAMYGAKRAGKGQCQFVAVTAGPAAPPPAGDLAVPRPRTASLAAR